MSHALLTIERFVARRGEPLHPIEVMIVDRIVKNAGAVQMCACGTMIAAEQWEDIATAWEEHRTAARKVGL